MKSKFGGAVIKTSVFIRQNTVIMNTATATGTCCLFAGYPAGQDVLTQLICRAGQWGRLDYAILNPRFLPILVGRNVGLTWIFPLSHDCDNIGERKGCVRNRVPPTHSHSVISPTVHDLAFFGHRSHNKSIENAEYQLLTDQILALSHIYLSFTQAHLQQSINTCRYAQPHLQSIYSHL